MAATGYRSKETEVATEPEMIQSFKQGAKRFGYLVAATMNTIMLWVAHQLLDWEWPGFLTAEYDDVLPVITVSFVASIVANLVYAWHDGWPIKPIGELVTTTIGLVAALRIWQVFPVEFTGTDWSWLVRLVLIVAVVGSALGIVTQLVNLARGPAVSGKS